MVYFPPVYDIRDIHSSSMEYWYIDQIMGNKKKLTLIIMATSYNK